MDNFNINLINEITDKDKKALIEEMDEIIFDSDRLSKQSDKLIRILEYSPKRQISERDIIKKIPIIKLKPPPPIEPQAIKTVRSSKNFKPPINPNTENKNKEVNQENNAKISDISDKPNNNNDKEVKQSENKEKKEEEKKADDDDDDEADDDDYERLLQQRQKKMEERERKIEKENDDEYPGIKRMGTKKVKEIKRLVQPRKVSNTSRLSSMLDLMSKLTVCLFSSDEIVEINISQNDTVKSVKTQIVRVLTEAKYPLKYTSENAYEIRLLDEDDLKPDMESNPLEDHLSIFDLKLKAIAFIENPKYKPQQDFSSEKILGNVRKITNKSRFYKKEEDQNKNEDQSMKNNEEKDQMEKVNIKVYYKREGINSSKIVSLTPEENLKDILKIFFNQEILQYKNFDFYFFVDHQSEQEPDNAINLETNIAYLPSFELDLCYKNFPDLPEGRKEHHKSIVVNLDEDKDLEEKKDESVQEKKDFLFNEITAGLYQEFEVVKINKYNNKQNRILGIDMYNLYNNLPRKRNSGIMNFIFKETKKPRRQMKDVKACEVTGFKSFYIDIKDETSDQVKRVIYEVKTNLIRDEIVAKINFLIKLNQENYN